MICKVFLITLFARTTEGSVAFCTPPHPLLQVHQFAEGNIVLAEQQVPFRRSVETAVPLTYDGRYASCATNGEVPDYPRST